MYPWGEIFSMSAYSSTILFSLCFFFLSTYYKRSYKHFLHCPFLLEKVFWTIKFYLVSLILLLLHKIPNFEHLSFNLLFSWWENTRSISKLSLWVNLSLEIWFKSFVLCAVRDSVLPNVLGNWGDRHLHVSWPFLTFRACFSWWAQIIASPHLCTLHRSQPGSSSSTFQTCV